jgi:hypothetical protein
MGIGFDEAGKRVTAVAATPQSVRVVPGQSRAEGRALVGLALMLSAVKCL